MRLVNAHVALIRAEFAEIMAEIKRFAVAAGIVFALGLFAGVLLPVGMTLFLGEWLFGSLGWGILHGLLTCVAIGVAAVLGAFGATSRQMAGWFAWGLVAGVVAGIVLGLDLPNQGWIRLGDSTFSAFEPGVRPLVTAVTFTAGAFAVIGLLAGLRAGGIGRGIGWLVGAAFLGALAGAFTAIHWDPRAGAAVGVVIGLIVWPAGLGASVMRRGIDIEGIKNRLIPNVTMQTTRETIEWMRQQTPLGRKS